MNKPEHVILPRAYVICFQIVSHEIGGFRSHHGVDERRADGQEGGSRAFPIADPQGRPPVVARQQGTREQDRRAAKSGECHADVPGLRLLRLVGKGDTMVLAVAFEVMVLLFLLSVLMEVAAAFGVFDQPSQHMEDDAPPILTLVAMFP